MWLLAGTGGCINSFFSLRKCMAVLPGRKKVTVKQRGEGITEVAVRRDSTVLQL